MKNSELSLRELFEPIIETMVQQKELFTAENIRKNKIKLHFMNGYEQIYYDLNKQAQHNNRLTREETTRAMLSQQAIYNEYNKKRIAKIRELNEKKNQIILEIKSQIKNIENKSIWDVNPVINS